MLQMNRNLSKASSEAKEQPMHWPSKANLIRRKRSQTRRLNSCKAFLTPSKILLRNLMVPPRNSLAWLTIKTILVWPSTSKLRTIRKLVNSKTCSLINLLIRDLLPLATRIIKIKVPVFLLWAHQTTWCSLIKAIKRCICLSILINSLVRREPIMSSWTLSRCRAADWFKQLQNYYMELKEFQIIILLKDSRRMLKEKMDRMCWQPQSRIIYTAVTLSMLELLLLGAVDLAPRPMLS